MQIGKFKAADENGRLAAVHRFEVLDTEPETEFADIVTLVKSIFNVPRAAINILDASRQWTKAGAGEGPSSVERADTICDHTIRTEAPLAVADASRDPRFAAIPLIAAPNGIRSYLGVPLTSQDGYNVGTLCIYDTKPRDFSEAEVDVLSNFARVVMSHMELRLSSRLDGLTAAMTPRAFSERVEAHRGQRTPGPATLLLIDIDHFKSINDRFGHAAGDEVLRQVADTIRGLMRKSDSFGRLGGEEFGVLLQGADPEAAMHLVRRVQAALAAREMAAIDGSRVTISMGMAGFSQGESRENWFARADRALYQAKANGRDQTVVALPAV